MVAKHYVILPHPSSLLAYLDLSADLPGLYHNERLVL